MLSTVSSATFILVLVLLLLNMAAGAYEKRHVGVFISFQSEETGENAKYDCIFGGGKRATLSEIQQKATPTKVTCEPSGSGDVECKFKDKVGCQEVTDECTKKFEAKYFNSVLPKGPCPNVG